MDKDKARPWHLTEAGEEVLHKAVKDWSANRRHMSKCSSCGKMVEGFGDSGFGPEYACECGSLWTGA
jgi:CTP-dependent riboflavin kinase